MLTLIPFIFVSTLMVTFCLNILDENLIFLLNVVVSTQKIEGIKVNIT